MKRAIYKRFFSLALYQQFFIERRERAMKVGFFTACSLKTDHEPRELISPWRKVRVLNHK